MFSPPLLYLTSTLATGFPSASLTVIITIPFSVELILKVVSTAGITGVVSVKLNLQFSKDNVNASSLN